MKRLLILQIIILALLNACNTTDDYFKQFNHKPELTVKGMTDSEFSKMTSDSMKVNCEYLLYYNIFDEEGEELEAFVNCERRFKYTIDNEKIAIIADRPGKWKFNVIATDSYGATDEVSIEFICFNNLAPVAMLEIEDIPGFQNEKRLNASKSYDPDSKYGGGIDMYRFYVNGKEIDKTYHSSINYAFPLSGKYILSLRVRDTDGEWSEMVSETTTIID
jgi:hypothetical protein